MKKLIKIYKNGEQYQVGDVTAAELKAVSDNVETVSGIATANTSAISGLQTSKQNKLSAGTGIEITTDDVINVTLDTDVFKLVDALPTEGIETNKIYVVPSSSTGETNIYTEYIYVNSAWEKLGEFKADVDLSDYYKKSETYSKTEVDEKVADADGSVYLTQTEYDALETKKANINYFIYSATTDTTVEETA